MQETMIAARKARWMLRVLGPYILVLGCYELLLLGLPKARAWPLEPRFILGVICSGLLSDYITPISIASGAWHIFLGITFLAQRPLLKTYLVSEFMLCLPNVISCFTLLVFGGWHGLAGRYIIYLCPPLWVESVVPMALAVGCLVERRWPE